MIESYLSVLLTLHLLSEKNILKGTVGSAASYIISTNIETNININITNLVTMIVTFADDTSILAQHNNQFLISKNLLRWNNG